MLPRHLLFTHLCQSLRFLMARQWRWRSKSSSCLSLARKTVRSASKTTWRSTEKSESMLAWVKSTWHNRADTSLLLSLILRLCGQQPDGTATETSSTNTLSVMFVSDASYVDRGFDAEFEAIDIKDRKWLTFLPRDNILYDIRRLCLTLTPSSTACPKQFQCRNQRCVKLELKCDGWNDCGDMSDELNCSKYFLLRLYSGCWF